MTLALAGAGCGHRAPPRAGAPGQEQLAARHPESAAARWAAVALPCRTVRQALGGFTLQASAQVASTLDGKPDRGWSERYQLACTARGDCHGRLDLSNERGVEFYRLGRETYFRHRYQQFLRFEEEPEEAERRIERIWTAGPAVLELLRPLIRLEPEDTVTVASRNGRRYRLQPRKHPAPVAATGRKAWRRHLALDRVSGHLVLDGRSGVLLRLQVRYSVHAPKGPHVVGLTGRYDGEVTAAGQAPRIAPPTNYTRARPRDREVLWERRLLGSGPLYPGWFRGGGPYAARKRLRSASRRARASFPSRAATPAARPPVARLRAAPPAPRRPALRVSP